MLLDYRTTRLQWFEAIYMSDQKNIKFICDQMLGRLTRWLRILGYDTEYPVTGPDSDLIARAAETERVLLTRDRTVSRSNKVNALYINSDKLEEQLAQLSKEFSLKLEAELVENEDGSLKNRCGLCNGILLPLPREDAENNVPEGVFTNQQKFWKCSTCKKIYWEGTHWDQIKERIVKITNDI